MTWIEIISKLEKTFEFKTVNPVSKDFIEAVIKTLGLSQEFVRFFVVTNGLSYEWFRILTIEDSKNIKHTWDSIQKANNVEKSKFDVDEEFLDRFVIFAEIGGGACAVFDKSDGSIWYEENGNLNRTDLSLAKFIETSLLEVTDL